jgi:hypothetical protein
VDPGDDNLTGIAAVSSDDIWAVGDHSYGDSSGLTLIEHWNGTQSIRQVPLHRASLDGLCHK